MLVQALHTRSALALQAVIVNWPTEHVAALLCPQASAPLALV